MTEVRRLERQGYRIGADPQLSDADLAAVLAALHSLPNKGGSSLEGRGRVAPIVLASGIRAMIKRYTRGGLLRMLVRNKYFRWGKSRSEREFEFIQAAHKCGVNVPRPLLFIERGGWWYDAWLVTEEIVGKQTLAEISREDEPRAADLMVGVCEQVAALINSHLFHVDLHPGNVLVDPSGKIFVLDFDKAYLARGSKNTLRDSYLCRWRRAVIKHHLPESLSEHLCIELRRDFDRGASRVRESVAPIPR